MALTRPIPTSGIWGDCKDLLFAEYLNMQAPDVKVLMRYGADRGWLDGQPAAVTRKVGRGSITYVGAWLDDAGMKKASQWMLTESSSPSTEWPCSSKAGIRGLRSRCRAYDNVQALFCSDCGGARDMQNPVCFG